MDETAVNIHLNFNPLETINMSKEKMKNVQKRKQSFEKRSHKPLAEKHIAKEITKELENETVIYLSIIEKELYIECSNSKKTFYLPKKEWKELKTHLENKEIKKICWNSKEVKRQLSLYGIELINSSEDLEIIAHLVDENREWNKNNLAELQVQVNEELKKDAKLHQYYEKIEKPLQSVLKEMEQTGITISPDCREEAIIKHTKNGKVYPEYSQTSTVTGRLSSFEPNIQGMEKSKRHHLIATNGYLLLSSDLKTQEPRFLAHFSKEEKLIQAFQNKQDIYSVLASELYKRPISDFPDGSRERSIAKTVLLAIIYGISPSGISKQTGLNIAESEKLVHDFYLRYGNVHKWMNTQIQFCRENGFVHIIGGRKRRIPEINSNDNAIRNRAERQAINSIIQGSSAVQTKIILLKLAKFCQNKPYDILASIHDEVILQVPETITQEEINQIEHIIINSVSLTVPFECETILMKQWGIPLIKA